MALCVAALPDRFRLALGDRRPGLLRQGPADPDRPSRQGPLRALRLDRRRDQDPLPRGRGRDRREVGARPGVHDLGLSAGADRRAVRDRRPRDVHRLRPRRGRGRAPDPRPGHLHARGRGRLERLDRVRRLRPARDPGRRQLDRRYERGRHQGRAGEWRRRRRAGEADPDARDAPDAALAEPGRALSARPARLGAAGLAGELPVDRRGALGDVGPVEAQHVLGALGDQAVA